MADTNHQNSNHVDAEGLLGRSQPREEYNPRRTWKNLLVLSSAYTIVFTAFGALQNLQSSLNVVAGLGVATLSCVYGGATLSCIVAPLILQKIGYKIGILISFTVHGLFVLANFKPTFYTMIPAGLALGCITGPVWISQGSYMTVLANRHAINTGKKILTIVSRFSGIFFAFFQSSFIWGNIAASVILARYIKRKPSCETNNSTHFNITLQPLNSSEQLLNYYNNASRSDCEDSSNVTKAVCGSKYCPGTGSSAIVQPPQYLIYVMLGIFLGFVLIGLTMVLLFLDNIKSSHPDGSEEKKAKNPTRDTVKLIFSKKMLLLLPIQSFSGLEQALIYGDFTQSFISCSLGVEMVGYCIACLGVMTASFAMIFGRLQKYLGIITFFTYALFANIALLVCMLVWKPDPSQVYVFFLVPAIWGSADGIYQAGITALLGYQFKSQKESAFAVFRLIQSMSSAIAFAYSPFLCMASKTYLALAVAIFTWACTMLFYFCYMRKKEEPEPVKMTTNHRSDT